ncbi:MAG: prepilin-type N-terminal cleavage/methylation domain-containing protein [Phycisphaerales bacterium]|nr:prepilin-type N-terminal cleavage/methylation domain-containing protein [Phycisphaerales bacterium]
MNEQRQTATARRGFSLIEVMIALAISAALLSATLVALDASFRAYQSTTEEVSTHSIARLVMHRLLTMVRTGTDFGPYPEDPRIRVIQSDFIQFKSQGGDVVTVRWNSSEHVLTYEVEGHSPVELLGGVIGTRDGEGQLVSPFILEYADGRRLYRATIDFTIEPDDLMDLDIEGDREDNDIRMVGSSMPRLEAF